MLKQGLRLTVAGVVLGMAGAFVLTRWLADLLFQLAGDIVAQLTTQLDAGEERQQIHPPRCPD